MWFCFFFANMFECVIQRCFGIFLAVVRHLQASKSKSSRIALLCIKDTGTGFWEYPRTVLPVCCSVLQCVAVCCSVLQCVTVCCSVLQCVVVCCGFFCRLIFFTLFGGGVTKSYAVCFCTRMCILSDPWHGDTHRQHLLDRLIAHLAKYTTTPGCFVHCGA